MIQAAYAVIGGIISAAAYILLDKLSDWYHGRK